MSIKDEIKQQLKNDIELVQKIEKLMIKVDIMSDNKRDMLLAGFSRNVLSHFISINYLMEKKLYNSAFALERIFFENIIKLKYMYYIMDEQKITTVYDVNSWDKHFPKPLQVMVDKIDLESGIEFYSEIKDRVYTIMNDYTHTGANQIARNFAELDASIESNFSDELILDTLQGNRTLLKTTMIVFLESIGLKNKFISESEIKEYLDY
jgi:hypothetical protein